MKKAFEEKVDKLAIQMEEIKALLLGKGAQETSNDEK